MLRVVVVQAPALLRQSPSDFRNMSVHRRVPPPCDSALRLNFAVQQLGQRLGASLHPLFALFLERNRGLIKGNESDGLGSAIHDSS